MAYCGSANHCPVPASCPCVAAAAVFIGVLLGCALRLAANTATVHYTQSSTTTGSAMVSSMTTANGVYEGQVMMRQRFGREANATPRQARNLNTVDQLASGWSPSLSSMVAGSLPALCGLLLLLWHRLSTPPASLGWQMVTTTGYKDDAIVVEAEVEDSQDVSPVKEATSAKEPCLCCPTCLRPLVANRCRTCSLEYKDSGIFLDLTPASGRPLVEGGVAKPANQESPLLDIPFVKASLPVIEQVEKVFANRSRLPRLSKVIKGEYAGDSPSYGRETFESPIVAGIYERGWRQSFARAGFPGPDEEFKKAMEWLLPVAKGKTILDLSCGSGLFTRRFVASGEFSKVYALDYSENMLKQTRQGFDKDPELSRQAVTVDLELVRGDVARLPFPSDSLPAIHAGAAIHCWPSPSLAMTEIARVLSPGGRAVLSTFLVPGQDVPFLNESIRGVLVTPNAGQGIRYWEETELRDLCNRVGLVGFEVDRKRDYIMFKVEKPQV